MVKKGNENNKWKWPDNIQCGYDSGVDGGMWRVDISVELGPAAWARYVEGLKENLLDWRVKNACDLG